MTQGKENVSGEVVLPENINREGIFDARTQSLQKRNVAQGHEPPKQRGSSLRLLREKNFFEGLEALCVRSLFNKECHAEKFVALFFEHAPGDCALAENA